MKQRKEMIDDERGYFFGFARGTYGEVLSELSKTRINSWRTSSIPLAEFWQPANLGRIGRLLYKYLPDFNPVCALKFFEFPTDALSDGERIGRPSMTDIMILEAGVQIAVEGKMTEYVRFADKTVREWLNEGVGAADILLRHRILKAWLCYIHNADCTGLEGFADFKLNCMDISSTSSCIGRRPPATRPVSRAARYPFFCTSSSMTQTMQNISRRWRSSRPSCVGGRLRSSCRT